MLRPLPEVLYIQDNGRLLYVNRTPNGALKQDGMGNLAGKSVSVYKLERTVEIIVDVAPPEPATPQE